MLSQWLHFTSSGYPSTQTGLCEIFWLSISLFFPSLSLTFFSLICLSSLAFSIHLISLSISLFFPFLFPFPLFIHLSPLPFVIHHSLVLFFPISLFPPSSPLFSFSQPCSSLPVLLEVSTLWVRTADFTFAVVWASHLWMDDRED